MSTTLTWDANVESDLSYYNIYRGTASQVYDSHERVDAPTTTLNVLGLVEGNRYYFGATAVDTSSNESSQSNEVTKMIPKFSPAIFI